MGTVELALLDKFNVDREMIGKQTCPINAEYVCRQYARRNNGFIYKVGRNLNPRSHYPDGWRVSEEGMRRFVSSTREFDLIWFFTLGTADVFPNAMWPRSVVDVDDVPSSFAATALQMKGGLKDRLLASLKVLALRRREKLLADRFTVITVCSDPDLQYLGRLGIKAPIHVIPNGFEKPRREPARVPATPPRVGFIGHFSHPANAEGIHWFMRCCWPHIKHEVPDARLRLVGPGSDGVSKSSGNDIDGLGWLADPADEMKTWAVMVVPIRMGSGTRVKIAHGFSQKCPIVSTLFGAQGYMARDAMYLADSEESFARACIKAIREPAQAAEMAERAWRQFLEKWTWDAIYPLVWAAAEDCLRLNHHSPTSFSIG